MKAVALQLEAELDGSLAECWEVLTTSRHLAVWFGPHLTLDARVGGKLEEHWAKGSRKMVTSGIITAFEPPRLLSMTWADSDWPDQTQVTIELEPYRTGTHLTLTHTGWEKLIGVDYELLSAEHEAGWDSHLRSLVLYIRGIPPNP